MGRKSKAQIEEELKAAESKAVELAKPAYEIPQNHKDYIKKTLASNPDIEAIVKILFGEQVDMRSPQVVAVKDYAVECLGRPIGFEEVQTELTEDQKALIDRAYTGGNSFNSIANLLWPHKKTGNFSKEWALLREYLVEKYDFKSIHNSKPPSEKELTVTFLVEKINASSEAAALDKNKLTSIQKSCVDHLKNVLKSARYKAMYETYNSKRDRELFERELIRAIWDKPDLTVDEVNSYMTLCDNYVVLLNNKERLNKLNEDFTNQENSSETNIRLTEIINAQIKEKNDCEQRIERMVKSLNGDRSKRIEARGANKANLNALFEAFKQEDERKRMLRIAALEREAVGKEIDRIENAEEFFARVVGLTKYSAL